MEIKILFDRYRLHQILIYITNKKIGIRDRDFIIINSWNRLREITIRKNISRENESRSRNRGTNITKQIINACCLDSQMHARWCSKSLIPLNLFQPAHTCPRTRHRVGGRRGRDEIRRRGRRRKKKATNLSRDYVISKLREILRGIGDGESRRKIVQGSGYVGSWRVLTNFLAPCCIISARGSISTALRPSRGNNEE